MAILSFDDYLSSTKQISTFYKGAVIATVANARFATYQITGDPGAGTLTGTNTTSGVLITSNTNGFHDIIPNAGTKYITRLALTSNTPCNLILQDLIYKAGSYSNGVSQTLVSPPSIAGRVVAGDYTNIDMYFECVTAFNGAPVITITYTNQDGVSGRTSATALGVTPSVGRTTKLVLQSGDRGVMSIESIACNTTSTVGTFNVLLVRDLYMCRIPYANGLISVGLDGTGMPQIFNESALTIVSQPDSTSSGAFGGYIEISSK